MSFSAISLGANSKMSGTFVALPLLETGGLVSSNGIDWTQTTVPSAYVGLIAYGDNKFVAADDGTAKVIYSSNGSTWTTSSTLPRSTSWGPIAYGNGKFVLLTSSATGYAAYSSDGITWSSSTTSSIAWSKVIYANGKFVAVGNSAIATSIDGITWTNGSIPAGINTDITYGASGFVVSRYSGNTALLSSDGITWTTVTLPATKVWSYAAYGNGVYLVMTESYVATSTDGINWSGRSLPTGTWFSPKFGKGLFVIANGDSSATNGIATSPDGITWTPRATPAFTNGGFFTVGFSDY